jgi:hypothetical protein
MSFSRNYHYWSEIVPILRFKSSEVRGEQSINPRPKWSTWCEEELEHLRKLYEQHPHASTKERRAWFPARTADSVAIKAGRLGLTKGHRHDV